MLEEWLPIDEFPGYYVSNYGRVRSEMSNRNLKWSPVQYGVPTVGLMKEDGGHLRQFRRSVPLLVARAFLPAPVEPADTPIHLDGDRSNPRADNLAWRPRWFAVCYHKERAKDPYPNWTRDIVLLDTGEVFAHPRDAAMKYGELEIDIYKSVMNRRKIFPHGHTYRFDEEVDTHF